MVVSWERRFRVINVNCTAHDNAIRLVRSIQMFMEKFRLEPSHTFVGSPKLACFVDIDLASLLSICLAELFANTKGSKPSFKDAAFAAEICRTRKSKGGSKVELGGTEKKSVRVIAQVQHLPFPIGFQRFGIAA